MRLGMKADDTLLEWTHSLQDVHEFHKFLNSIPDTIQWSELDIEKVEPSPCLMPTRQQLESTI